jgi:hypothetical protein
MLHFLLRKEENQKNNVLNYVFDAFITTHTTWYTAHKIPPTQPMIAQKTIKQTPVGMSPVENGFCGTNIAMPSHRKKLCTQQRILQTLTK